MPHPTKMPERHAVQRVGWLRAAVLGANDGIVSTASLIAGMAASSADKPALVFAGLAAWVAGAMSMAAGEYVSVSSQADTEAADLALERRELTDMPDHELRELAAIYRRRGLDEATALAVAQQLTAHDALDAHARDELGISPGQRAQPLQAAFTSATTFTAGALAPLLATWLAPREQVVAAVTVASLVYLAVLGIFSARAGGSPWLRPTLRVVFWGAAAIAVTVAIGKLFGTVVG